MKTSIATCLALLAASLALAADSPPAIPAAPAGEAYKLEAGPCTPESVPKIVLHDAARNKDLPVAVVYPKEGGPWPTIVFSHGAGGEGNAYLPLLRYWVSHGYVCLAPTHADSLSLAGQTEETKGGMLGIIMRLTSDGTGWTNRARDVSFVIDSLKEIEKKVPALNGRMDAKRLGVGGHSYGAFTTLLIGGATVDMPGGERGKSFADPRPAALLVLSGMGVGQMGLTLDSWGKIARPMMLMTGTKDLNFGGKGAEWRLQPLKHMPPPDKYALMIEGVNHLSFLGWHAEGGVGAAVLGAIFATDDTSDQKAAFDYIKIPTIAFWDAYLKSDAKAKTYLASDALPSYSKGAVRLERK